MASTMLFHSSFPFSVKQQYHLFQDIWKQLLPSQPTLTYLQIFLLPVSTFCHPLPSTVSYATVPSGLDFCASLLTCPFSPPWLHYYPPHQVHLPEYHSDYAFSTSTPCMAAGSPRRAMHWRPYTIKALAPVWPHSTSGFPSCFLLFLFFS